jgi:hypothetical protein
VDNNGTVRQATSDNIVRLRCIAYWIHKARDTHLEYCFSTAKIVVRKHLSITFMPTLPVVLWYGTTPLKVKRSSQPYSTSVYTSMIRIEHFSLTFSIAGNIPFLILNTHLLRARLFSPSLKLYLFLNIYFKAFFDKRFCHASGCPLFTIFVIVRNGGAGVCKHSMQIRGKKK